VVILVKIYWFSSLPPS